MSFLLFLSTSTMFVIMHIHALDEYVKARSIKAHIALFMFAALDFLL